MLDSNYWADMYGDRSAEFVEGIKIGITAYAYWEDGVQYVGVELVLLSEVLKEVDEAFGTGGD